MKRRVIPILLILIAVALGLVLWLRQNPREPDGESARQVIPVEKTHEIPSERESIQNQAERQSENEERQNTAVSICGKVTDTVGNPLSGGTVLAARQTEESDDDSASWDSGTSAKIDTGGSYEFNALEKGTYLLCASADGFDDSIQSDIVVDPGESTEEPVVVDFTLDRISGFKGRVISAIDGEPIEEEFRIRMSQAMEGGGTMSYTLPKGLITRRQDGYFLAKESESTATIRLFADGYQLFTSEEFEIRKGEVTDLGALKLEKGTTLRIKVTTGDQDALVYDAVVTVRDDSTPEFSNVLIEKALRTDVYGRCDVENIPPGTVYIFVSHENYPEKTHEVEVRKTEQQDIAIKLEEPVTLTGEVISSEDGLPIAGADIFLRRMLDEHSWAVSWRDPHDDTDESGAFEIGRLAAGRYRVQVTHEEYADYYAELSINHGTQPQTFRLLKGGTLVVMAKDESGNPLAGYSVSGWGGLGAGGKTDKDGLHVFKNIRPGEIEVSVKKADVRTMGRQKSVTVSNNKTSKLEFVFKQSYVVSGKITKAGKPAKGLRVYIRSRWMPGEVLFEGGSSDIPLGGMDTDSEGRFKFEDNESFDGGTIPQAGMDTDADGRFKFENIEPGKYELDVNDYSQGRSDDLMSREIMVIDDDQEVNISIPTSSISGRIFDTQGNPIPGVGTEVYKYEPLPENRIWEDGTQEELLLFRYDNLKTDSDGKYVLENVPGGKYRIYASRDGYIKSIITVDKSEERDFENADMTMPTAVKITGRITASDGAVIKSIRICGDSRKLDSLGEPWGYSITVDQDGGYVFQRLPMGECFLEIAAKGYVTQRREVKLASDIVSDIDFVLQKASTLRITVKNSLDYVISNASIKLTSLKSDRLYFYQSDDIGIASFEDLPPGKYKAVVRKEGLKEKTIELVVNAEDKEIEVVLEEKE